MAGKYWILLICALALAAIGLLATSLHDVRFEPGRPLTVEQPAPVEPTLPQAETVEQMPLWKALLFWLAFVVNMLLFYYLLPPEMRKRVLRQVISITLGTLAVLLALRYRLIQLPDLNGTPLTQTNPGFSSNGTNTPLPAFAPPHVTPWWMFAISFAVLTVVVLGLWAAYRWWTRASRYTGQLDAIREIARSSLDDLAAGHQWSDVIIQSYVRMSDAVRDRRGLQRHWAATPREFAARLQEAGLPQQAVTRLTRLFESARYGAGSSSQAEVNEAVACLNSILQACGQLQ